MKREGIVSTVITVLALVWTIMDLIYEAPIFFTLFGALVCCLAGKRAYQFWKNYKGKKG